MTPRLLHQHSTLHPHSYHAWKQVAPRHDAVQVLTACLPASADSTGLVQAWKRDPSDVASHVASRRLTQAVNQHKQKKTGKTLEHMRAATLTLGIVRLPTDSVRKVYRVKRNKAKGKVCKSKRAAPRKSPGRGTEKNPAATTGQKRHRGTAKTAGSQPPNKRRNVYFAGV